MLLGEKKEYVNTRWHEWLTSTFKSRSINISKSLLHAEPDPIYIVGKKVKHEIILEAGGANSLDLGSAGIVGKVEGCLPISVEVNR